MKIKRFNKTTVAQREPGAPNVYIHYGGSFAFNQPASILLGAVPDAKVYIEVIQDEENPKDWFISITNEDTGILLRPGKKSGAFSFNSGIIAKELLKTLPKSEIGTSAKTANLLISSSPQEFDGMRLWPIITSSYKPRIAKKP